jgi:phosphomannomutase / phosphoglucomutase
MAQLRPVLPVLAAVLVLLAAWLAWSGWQLREDAAASQALEQARDEAVQGAAAALAAEQRQMQAQLASAPVQAALARGDLGQAGSALASGWRGVEEAAVFPLDLEDPYARLEEGGYGRLAALEAALVADDTVATIAREGTGPRLLVTAPARAGDVLVGVAYARLPLLRATAPVAGVTLQDDDAFLALRQGGPYRVRAR